MPIPILTSTEVLMESQETRLVRIERKLDQLLELFKEYEPSDEAVSEAIELFIEDALLPKWLSDD